MCGHHYTQTNINKVNKAYALLQTTWGKDESNIGFDAEIVRDITKRNSERKVHIIGQHEKTRDEQHGPHQKRGRGVGVLNLLVNQLA